MFLFAAEAVLKAEVLCKTEVMSRAEVTSGPEYSPPLQYETAVKPTILSMPDMLPRGEVTRSQAPLTFEEPNMEPSRSEIFFESNESSNLEDSSMSEAYPGPEEVSNVEFSMPGVLAESRYFPDEYLGPEAAGCLLEAEHSVQDEPTLEPLRILVSLQDPFAEVEAKLARLSSTVAMTDLSQMVVPQLPQQVTHVLCSRQDGLGAERSPHMQGYWPLLLSVTCLGTLLSCGLERRYSLRHALRKLGWRPQVMLDGHLFPWQGTGVWRGGGVAELTVAILTSQPKRASEPRATLQDHRAWGASPVPF